MDSLDKPRCEMEFDLGIQLGISRGDYQSGILILRRPRSSPKIFIPILATQGSHACPSRSNISGRKHLQQGRYDLPRPFQVFPVAMEVESQLVVHSPAELEIQRDHHAGRSRPVGYSLVFLHCFCEVNDFKGHKGSKRPGDAAQFSAGSGSRARPGTSAHPRDSPANYVVLKDALPTAFELVWAKNSLAVSPGVRRASPQPILAKGHATKYRSEHQNPFSDDLPVFAEYTG